MRAYNLKALDINTDTTTGPDSRTNRLAMDDARQVGIYVNAKTGDHDNHIITLQISGDQAVNWEDTAHTITGIGHLANIEVICTHVRGKVTTAEGSTSTVDIFIVIK